MAVKQFVSTRRVPLDPAKKSEMLAILMRNPTAFTTVKDTLTVDHLILQMGNVHALIWRCVLEFFAKYRALPDKGTLMSELNAALAENPVLVAEDELPAVDEFVEYAFADVAEHGADISSSDTHYRVALDTAHQLIEDYTTTKLREDMFHDGTVPIDIVGALERRRQELEAAKSMKGTKFEVPFPEAWDEQGTTTLTSSGCTVLDEFMGGGWAAQEIMIFLGPYGSCKTTTAVSCVANLLATARHKYRGERCRVDQNPQLRLPLPPKPVVVLAFTEGTVNEYRRRLLSNMAVIPHTRLMQTKLADLSDSERPGEWPGTDYERRTYEDAIETGLGFRSERQRVATAVSIANDHLFLIDCVGDSGNAQAAPRSVADLGAALRAYLQQHPTHYFQAIFLDHLSAMADRLSAYKGLQGDREDSSSISLLLKRLLRELQDSVARPFDCPVACFHQLTGAANSKGPLAEHSHADASRCKEIAEYANFAIVTGCTNDDGICRWKCTKHRREPSHGHRLVQVLGAYNKIKNVSEVFVVNESYREIVPRTENTVIAQVHSAGFAHIRDVPGASAE